MISGGSGLSQQYEESPEQAFLRFIGSSTPTGRPMTGASGYLVRYSGPDNVYKSIDIDTYSEPVTTIIIKLVFISDNISEKQRKRGIKDYIQIGSKELAMCPISEFEEEVMIQTDVHESTLTGNEPLCPTILFSKIYENRDNIIEILTLLKLDKLLNPVISSLAAGELKKVGVIAMEFADDYDTMHSYLVNYPHLAPAFYMIAAFLLIELAHKTGYTQGDFHVGNIFFKTLPSKTPFPYFKYDDNYFESLDTRIVGHSIGKNIKKCLTHIRRFKPLIIDFGRAKKLIMTGMYDINKLYREHNYRQVLGFICAQGCNQPTNTILRYPDFYQWASGYTKIIDSVNDKTAFSRYLNMIENNKLVFFYPPDHFGEIMDQFISFLNSNFDGTNRIMHKIIKSRIESEKDIIAQITQLTIGDVAQHTGDVAQHTGDVAQHTGDVAQHTGDVVHTEDVAQHTGDVAQHTEDVVQHTGDVVHTEDVAQHPVYNFSITPLATIPNTITGKRNRETSRIRKEYLPESKKRFGGARKRNKTFKLKRLYKINRRNSKHRKLYKWF